MKEIAGIRVVAVAPGITKSPLFTDHPQAMRFIDESKDYMLDTAEVARGMLAVATELKYPPGTVLEVADPGNWRVVHLLNDPGPQGKATTSSRKDETIADIKRILDAERKGSSSTSKL